MKLKLTNYLFPLKWCVFFMQNKYIPNALKHLQLTLYISLLFIMSKK